MFLKHMEISYNRFMRSIYAFLLAISIRRTSDGAVRVGGKQVTVLAQRATTRVK